MELSKNNDAEDVSTFYSSSNSFSKKALMENNEYAEYRKTFNEARKGNDLGFPIHIEVENIYGCNLNCVHCARQYVSAKKLNIMDFSLYKEIIDQATAMGTKSMGLSIWGEVFLDKDVFPKIRYAREKGIIDIRLHSNGILITDKIAENIVTAGVTWMSVSIDALSKEIYQKNRIGDFNKAISSLGKLINAKMKLRSLLPSIRVSFVKTSINEHQADEFTRVYGQYFDVAIQHFIDPGKLMPKELNPKVMLLSDKTQCFENFYKVFIRTDGTVVPCCEDIQSQIILGNIRQNSLGEIYNGSVAKELRKQHLDGNIKNALCKKCLCIEVDGREK